MIKGAHKKMIVLKTSDSDVFEEAYFVLRRESVAEEEDMVREANRIIEAGDEKRRNKRKMRNKELLLGIVGFLCGSLMGGGLAVLIALLL